MSTIDVKDLMDDVTFSLEATGPKSQNMTLKNQQMIQLMGMVQDPAQKQKLFDELLRTMNLNPEDYASDIPVATEGGDMPTPEVNPDAPLQ